jgi:hypothetical protein
MTIHDLIATEFPFREALTGVELANLVAYEGAVGTAGRTHQMNQFYNHGHGTSSPPSGELYTICANPALHFNCDTQRWFLPSELLLCQGFPLLGHLAVPRSGTLVRCTSFMPPTPAAPSRTEAPHRRRGKVMHQAGNSMQLAVVGAVWFYIAVCLKLRGADDDVVHFIE